MRAVSMAGNVTFGAPSSILPSQGKHIATVAAPVRPYICDGFEPMRYPMVNLVFVILLLAKSRIRLKDMNMRVPIPQLI